MPLNLLYAFIPGEFNATIKKIEEPVAKAATGAILEARSIVLTEGRQAIAAAGFSRRWQNRFRSQVNPKQGAAINISVTFFDTSFFTSLFSQGGTHTGKPFMWLPLDTVPIGAGHKRLTPKQYRARIGPLFSVRRAGKPILVGKGSSSTIARATAKAVRFRKAAVTRGILRGPNVPLFIGISTVNIPKKFDVKSIIDRVQDRIGELYLKHFQAGK